MMELKPCPTIWCSRDDTPHTWQGSDDRWFVICPDCNVEGLNADTEAEAIAAWNQRAVTHPATDAAPDGLEYRKTATIRAVQWFKMGDHPAVVLKSDPHRYADEGIPWIDTLEGGHIVTPGDWIATGVKGEHWPIKPDVFAASYEPAMQPEPAGSELVAEECSWPGGQAKEVLAEFRRSMAEKTGSGRDATETAWLIERDDTATVESNNRVCLHYYAAHRPGRHWWTPDHMKAKRFATEAEARAETNGDPLLRVAEHMWIGGHIEPKPDPVAAWLYETGYEGNQAVEQAARVLADHGLLGTITWKDGV